MSNTKPAAVRANNEALPLNVIVIFTQGDNHVHNWETTYDSLSLDTLLEAACSTGLVNKNKSLSFEVFDEDDASETGEPILNGSFNSRLLKI